ncbi:MAG: cupin domain-containing protein [Cyclobacteriaceae bacterium]|jgi:uncharacterized protein YjlB
MISEIVVSFVLLITISDYSTMYSAYQIHDEKVILQEFKDDGTFPNSKYPVIVYKEKIDFSRENGPVAVEALFKKNGWGNSWRNGIYSYHHYHSTAHEVLGVYSGSANVMLGGEKKGKSFHVEKGDVILIPAGVAHKKLSSSNDFRVVGAYPEGQSWDMNYGKEGERPAADENISNVPYPKNDPVYGESGPLKLYWK